MELASQLGQSISTTQCRQAAGLAAAGWHGVDDAVCSPGPCSIGPIQRGRPEHSRRGMSS